MEWILALILAIVLDIIVGAIAMVVCPSDEKV